MFEATISRDAQRVLAKITKTSIGRNFYLAGGTGLAIQLGHRESIDLDWFSDNDFSNLEIKNEMAESGDFKVLREDEGTIHGELDGIKITFLRYQYLQLFPTIDFQGIKLADERDIAAMKIDAVSSRGSKKDFIDIFFMLEKYSLSEMISFFEKKFENIAYNKIHILKSLVYFEDAENEPMPVMLKPVDWEGVKNKINQEALDYLDKL